MASDVPRVRFRTEYICLKCGHIEHEHYGSCPKCGGPMCPRVIRIAVR